MLDPAHQCGEAEDAVDVEQSVFLDRRTLNFELMHQ
jgi:hypothetical protein